MRKEGKRRRARKCLETLNKLGKGGGSENGLKMDQPELDNAVGGVGSEVVEEGETKDFGEVIGVHFVLVLELHHTEEELEECVKGVKLSWLQFRHHGSKSSSSFPGIKRV